MDKKIFLTEEELNQLRYYANEVGHGSDGRVFPYKKDYLIKLYRKALALNTLVQKKNKSQENEDDDIKIYVMKKDRDPSEKIENKSIYELSEHITYYRKDDDNPEHDTKLAPSEAITAAIRRQKNIKRTQLPLASVYYNHRFIGCVIKKLHGVSIHKLMWLPMSAKIKIINSVIDDLDELMQNHVYHRDLSNSPFAGVGYINEDGKYIYENGHSHVLVNPLSLKTNIIDLDGKSTIYTERDNNALKEQCIRELLVLLFEYVFAIKLNDYLPTEDVAEYDYLVHVMEMNGFEPYDLEDFTDYVFSNCHELDDVRKIVKSIKTK